MTAPGPPRQPSGTLRRRLQLRSLVFALIVAVLLSIGAYALVQVMRYQDRVASLYFKATAYSHSLIAWTEAAGISVDEYLATGYEPALASFQEPAIELPDQVLTDFASGNDAEAAIAGTLAEADRQVRQWQTEFAQPAVDLVAANGPAAVSAETAATVQSRLQLVLETTQRLSTELAAGRAEAARQLNFWTYGIFYVVVMLAVASVFIRLASWYTLSRWILRPLSELATKAEAVSRGEVGIEVRTDAPGEIAALAIAVDNMRIELVERMAQAQASEAEIARVHQRTVSQAEELRRSNRDLEQFAYVASHDLQEPLRKVASFTQLLQQRYHGRLDERADQYIEFAVDGAKRMQQLIQDLLGFSRVGRSGVPTAPVDLEKVCTRALATFDERIKREGVVVEVGPLPTVLGQQTLLIQLFENLIGNSLKFQSPDRSPHLSIGSARVDGGWELWCSDNGIGIAAEYAERVFVIFQRLHSRDSYEGTGIGLALCKKIVEHHGGEIWVDPNRTEGTTIRWTLPGVGPRETGVPQTH